MINNIKTHRINSEKRGWVDILAEPIFASNGTFYFALFPLRDRSHGFFRQIVQVETLTKRVLPLTHGQNEVTSLLYWDECNNWMYVFNNKKKLH